MKKSLEWAKRTLLQMVSGLGTGEKQVLALALQKPGSLAILDDRTYFQQVTRKVPVHFL